MFCSSTKGLSACVCTRVRSRCWNFSGILALVLDVFKDTMTQDQTRDNETDEFCDEKMG